MSFGAISAPVVRALSRGAARIGCWMDTGEGDLSPYHLEGSCDIIMQVTSARAAWAVCVEADFMNTARGFMIAHSCGCRHARELKREHVRIVQSANQSIALNMPTPIQRPVSDPKAWSRSDRNKRARGFDNANICDY